MTGRQEKSASGQSRRKARGNLRVPPSFFALPSTAWTPCTGHTFRMAPRMPPFAILALGVPYTLWQILGPFAIFFLDGSYFIVLYNVYFEGTLGLILVISVPSSTRHAPRTTTHHHAPRTATHHAPPRTTHHHAPRTTTHHAPPRTTHHHAPLVFCIIGHRAGSYPIYKYQQRRLPASRRCCC